MPTLHHCYWECEHPIYLGPPLSNQYLQMNVLTSTTGAIDCQVCWEGDYGLFSPCSTSSHDRKKKYRAFDKHAQHMSQYLFGKEK